MSDTNFRVEQKQVPLTMGGGFGDSNNAQAAVDSMTELEADGVAMNQSALVSRVSFQSDENGRSFLDFNPNSSPEKVAFAGSVNEGMPLDRNKYLAAVDAVGLKWSGAADGYNNDTVLENALNEVWFNGAEEMFGHDVTEAQGRAFVKDRLLELMRRTHAFAPADKDPDLVQIDDIMRTIDSKEWKRDMSRFSSDARLLKMYVPVKQNTALDGFMNLGALAGDNVEYAFKGDASANHDLYNRFMGRGWQNGKMIEAKKWREEWWRETQDGDMPKDEAGWNKAFRSNAGEFALWYREHAVREDENYKERFRIAARTEILRRLGDARARGQKLNEYAIINSVLDSKDGGDAKSPYDDKWHWPDVLTEDDVARMEQRRMDCIAARWKAYERAAEDARGVVAGMREGAAKAKADAEAKKKAEEDAKKKADAEAKAVKAADEKERKELEKRQKYGTSKEVIEWSYDYGDNWDEPEGVRISAKRMAAVRKALGWEEGDMLFAEVKVQGKSKLLFPVIGNGYDGEDLGVALNARAQSAVTKNGKRGRVNFDAEGNGEIVFKIQKKK